MGCFDRKNRVTDSVTGVWALRCAYRRVGHSPVHKLIEDPEVCSAQLIVYVMAARQHF